MSTVVMYVGGAPVVESSATGLVFPRGEHVEVPDEIASGLGSDFVLGPDTTLPQPPPPSDLPTGE